MGRKPMNLIGQKFGRLTPIEMTEKRDGHRSVIWKCQCDCGNITFVPARHLVSNHTQSCGCYQKEKTSLATTNDILGKRFGKLTVIEKTNKRLHSFVIWKCKCDCGNVIEIIGASLTSGRSQSCGCQKSRGEDLIARLLRENNISFEKQKTFNTCRFPDTNALAYFDFWVDNKYIIEYDGRQHFDYEGYGWNTEEQFKITKAHDQYKNQWCKENNIPIIRIPYTRFNSLKIEDLIINEDQEL